MRVIRFISFIGLAFVAVGCVGVGNQPGAPYVETAALSGATPRNDCHYEAYQTSVVHYIQNQCVSCHAGNAGGLLLAGGDSNDVLIANYFQLLKRINSSLTNSEQTLLVKKITTGSGISHAYQRPSSEPIILDFNTFAQGLLTDPSCTASGDSSNGCLDENCFF